MTVSIIVRGTISTRHFARAEFLATVMQHGAWGHVTLDLSGKRIRCNVDIRDAVACKFRSVEPSSLEFNETEWK